MPKNLIQHHEWTTRDSKRLQSFYGKIFDWTFVQAMPDYTLIEGVGGFYAAPDPQVPVGVTNYITVDDLGKKEELVKSAGGQIHVSKQEVPNMGWFTIFGDPDGNTVALWQPIAKPKAAPKKAKAKSKKPAKKSKPAKKAKKKK